MINSIDVRGFRIKPKPLTFKGKEDTAVKLPKPLIPPEKEIKTVSLPGLSVDVATKIIQSANRAHLSVNKYLETVLPHLKGVAPVDSVSAVVGNSTVTTLIDAGQIFNKVTEMIKKADKSIQVEMFEFQNLAVDGDIWPTKGAEEVPGWSDQQQILELLVKKKKANPDLDVQVILDVHKWYQDGLGDYKRHYNNMAMLKYLQENDIDVIPYPRGNQGGAVLQHVKLLAVDGKNVLLGGMNWGNHSSANHDACISIEALPGKKECEAANIIDGVFNKDWLFSWNALNEVLHGELEFIPGPLTAEEAKEEDKPDKEILAENVEYMNLLGPLYLNDTYKARCENQDYSLPQLDTMKNSEIKLFTTSPREYEAIGAHGDESIGNYIKERLNTAKSLRAELFVLSHKEIVNKIVDRYQEAQNGGMPFDVEILVSPGILEDFVYCTKAYRTLKENGVPIRMFRTNNSIDQRLHTKWAVFDNEELLIGSANWSAVGLENNISTGKRNDYPTINEEIDELIDQSRHKILDKENFLRHEIFENEGRSFKSVFAKDESLDTERLSKNRRLLKKHLKQLAEEYPNGTSNERINRQKIEITKLIGLYKLMKEHDDHRPRYARGNHECAVSVTNKKIAETFIQQFSKDWEYSKPLDIDDNVTDINDYRDNIAFYGRKNAKMPKITAGNNFSKLV